MKILDYEFKYHKKTNNWRHYLNENTYISFTNSFGINTIIQYVAYEFRTHLIFFSNERLR